MMALVWQRELQDAVRDIDEVIEVLGLPEGESERLREVAGLFPLQIPRSYLGLIDRDDPNDPIRNLVVPGVYELNREGLFDQSGEADNTRLPGLQHKYRATVLLLASDACAGYCRYCFRKRLFDSEVRRDEYVHDLEPALEYIRAHEEVSNVLISGGDPLLLSTSKLGKLLSGLSKIGHVGAIRIGSKVPAYLPSRITSDPGLVRLLSKHSRKERRLYVVTHFDHPRELRAEAVEAIDLLVRAGVVVVNQAVLVRGINDNPETLRELFNRLTQAGVAPYYVFQCRPVVGSLEVQVPLARGYAIVEAAKRACTGLAKRLRYAMSHYSGKVEIVGVMGEGAGRRVYLKYHQARDPQDEGRFFSRLLPEGARWLDDLPAGEPRVPVGERW